MLLETQVLHALLEDRTAFVSGAHLAKKFRVSRVAIWHQMEKLRGQGYVFEAVRNVGYRIASLPVNIHPPLIELLLAPRKLDYTLNYHACVDSTNDEAARQLAAECRTPNITIARKQTRGRGRFGRLWHSEDNGNLYISFAFRPRVSPVRMQTFTLWMGVNICELIDTYTPPTATKPGIKWPNDILFDGRKAGGILTEARMDADQIRDLVFGFGLNLNNDPTHWPADLVRRATSLAQQNNNTPIDTNSFAADLITRVLQSYDRFINDGIGSAATLVALWNRYDILRGKSVTIVQGNHNVTGIANGIDEEGSLILKDTNNRTHRFRAGEVTIEKKA